MCDALYKTATITLGITGYARNAEVRTAVCFLLPLQHGRLKDQNLCYSRSVQQSEDACHELIVFAGRNIKDITDQVMFDEGILRQALC